MTLHIDKFHPTIPAEVALAVASILVLWAFGMLGLQRLLEKTVEESKGA